KKTPKKPPFTKYMGDVVCTRWKDKQVIFKLKKWLKNQQEHQLVEEYTKKYPENMKWTEFSKEIDLQATKMVYKNPVISWHTTQLYLWKVSMKKLKTCRKLL